MKISEYVSLDLIDGFLRLNDRGDEIDLTREEAASLIPLLRHYFEHGDLPEEDVDKETYFVSFDGDAFEEFTDWDKRCSAISGYVADRKNQIDNGECTLDDALDWSIVSWTVSGTVTDAAMDQAEKTASVVRGSEVLGLSQDMVARF